MRKGPRLTLVWGPEWLIRPYVHAPCLWRIQSGCKPIKRQQKLRGYDPLLPFTNVTKELSSQVVRRYGEKVKM